MHVCQTISAVAKSSRHSFSYQWYSTGWEHLILMLPAHRFLDHDCCMCDMTGNVHNPLQCMATATELQQTSSVLDAGSLAAVRAEPEGEECGRPGSPGAVHSRTCQLQLPAGEARVNSRGAQATPTAAPGVACHLATDITCHARSPWRGAGDCVLQQIGAAITLWHG